MSLPRPFRIMDRTGRSKYGVVASSLQGLMEMAQKKFDIIPSSMKIVLEDGTKVDDEEYFKTLEPNTCLVVLKEEEDTTAVAGSSGVFDMTRFTKTREDDLRRKFYSYLANSESITNLCHGIISKMKIFFRQNAITSNEDQMYEDLLYSFIQTKNVDTYDDSEIKEISILQENIQIFDHCLSQPIEVSEKILAKKARFATCGITEELGYQHIYRHKMLDVDELSDATMESLLSSCSEPESKRPKLDLEALKACQLKIWMKAQGMKKRHDVNWTKLKLTKTKLDVLILFPLGKEEICKQLASHLGIIFLEDVYALIEGNAKNKKLYENVENENSKLYPLFQNYVARCLMLGLNNVTITCNESAFVNLSANMKYIIYNTDQIDDLDKLSMMTVKVEHDSFYEYLSATAEILNHVLGYKIDIAVVYRSHDNKLYKCQVSALAIIPLYILRYIVRKRTSRNNLENSIFEN